MAPAPAPGTGTEPSWARSPRYPTDPFPTVKRRMPSNRAEPRRARAPALPGTPLPGPVPGTESRPARPAAAPAWPRAVPQRSRSRRSHRPLRRGAEPTRLPRGRALPCPAGDAVRRSRRSSPAPLRQRLATTRAPDRSVSPGRCPGPAPGAGSRGAPGGGAGPGARSAAVRPGHRLWFTFDDFREPRCRRPRVRAGPPGAGPRRRSRHGRAAAPRPRSGRAPALLPVEKRNLR